MDDSRTATMRAVVCIDRGRTLIATEAARPPLRDGHIRVETHCCGLSVPDLLMLQGRYQVTHTLPFIPGSEIVGIVREVAPDVRHLQVGDRVAGLNFEFCGGMAEEMIVPATIAARIPAAVPFPVATGLLVSYSTSLYALLNLAKLQPGETVLVLGAGGCVGAAAVQLAKILGARVIAAVGLQHKVEPAMRLGADDALVYTSAAFKDELKARGGADVVVDTVGGAITEQALRGMRHGGRLLVVGFATGEIPRIPLNLVLLKSCSIVGVFLNAQLRHSPAQFLENMATIFDLWQRGQLPVATVLFDCMTDFQAAFDHVADRHKSGKVVVYLKA